MMGVPYWTTVGTSGIRWLPVRPVLPLLIDLALTWTPSNRDRWVLLDVLDDAERTLERWVVDGEHPAG